MTELYRTEHYILAANRGMSHSGDTEIVTCAAWAGIYNPLGQLLANMSDEVTDAQLQDFKVELASLMYKSGYSINDSAMHADIASVWYLHRWCPCPAGRGTGKATERGDPCPLCDGSGLKPKPQGNGFDSALAHINNAIDYFERQLSARASGYLPEPNKATIRIANGCKLSSRLPSADQQANTMRDEPETHPAIHTPRKKHKEFTLPEKKKYPKKLAINGK